jgi:DNA-binding SARP family transcriptional activator
MSTPRTLARPQFVSPLPPRVAVRRPRLIRRICDAAGHALVSAPAGYGKTMLLAHAAEASSAEWIWITCNEQMITSASLAEVVAAATAERIPDVEPHRVKTAADPWATLAEMTSGGWWDDLVVVIEEFERLPAMMHVALRRLIARPPAGARIVLAGRRQPVFELSRLRAEGLVEITADDLTASVDEARAFVAALGIDPGVAVTTAVMSRSEGWPAAVRLLAETASGSTQPAVDYVREEVIGRLSDALVEFVASTRGPKTLGVGEAERLSGRRDAQAMIEQLLSLQALTFRVPGAALRVRYHGLLRAALAPARSRPQTRGRHATTQPDVTLRCLGGLCVMLGDHELSDPALGRPRERALLAVLICARRPLHREELIEVLWPGLSLSAALAALHSSVYRLRRALRPCAKEVSIKGDGETYRLALAKPSCCDALELIACARGAIARHDRAELEALAVLGTGPFLPEWPYAEWARGLRTEVEETYREILEAVAHERTSTGDTSGAIGQYRRLLALEPEREGWHRELMRLYAATGERALALRQYQLLAERLRTELGIEPCAESRELHRSLLVGDSSSVTAAPSA